MNRRFLGLAACGWLLGCLGTARASFVNTPLYPVGPNANAVAVADFNGDGIADLAVAGFSGVDVLFGKGDGSFQAAVHYAVGENLFVLTADFNGDGHADLALAGENQLTILLGNGDGTFQAPQASAAAVSLAGLAVGDLNGDGIPDLVAVTNAYNAGTDNRVSILLGNGDGSFQAGESYTYPDPGTGVLGIAVALADFNRDGILYLAVSNRAVGSLDVLLGNGDGTFRSVSSTVHAFLAGTNLAAADLNGDGISDLILPGTEGLTVLLGKGDGTFQPPFHYRTGVIAFVTVGDFNGDGNLDVAAATAGGVALYLGDGQGGLQVGPLYAPGSSFVVAGDFNGDGNADLAVLNLQSTAVSVLLGTGQGTFQAAPCFAAGVKVDALAFGDFNGDGAVDLVVSGDTVSTLLGNGDGTFQAAHGLTLGQSSNLAHAFSVAVGDFDGDGVPDLAVARYGADNPTDGQISIYLGKGDGTFRLANRFSAGAGPVSITVVDLNGDGKLDLVTTNAYAFVTERIFQPVENNVRVFLGNGDGTFSTNGIGYPAGSGPASVAVADFNGDGILDLAVTNDGYAFHPNGTVSILLGNGDGTFRHEQVYDVHGFTPAVAVGDFNGDGRPDLAVTTLDSLSIWLGTGDGTFQPTLSYPFAYRYRSPVAVTVGDFNRDGNVDLVLAKEDTVSVLLGNGDGSFQAAQDYSVSNSSIFVGVADFNGDGYPDLAIVNYAGTVTILLNAADWR